MEVRIRQDRGEMVLGWLLKITLFIAVLGVLALDAMSVAVSHVSVMDNASASATAGADVLRAKKTALKRAYEASERVAAQEGARIVPDTWFVDEAGAVHVTVEKVADTFVFKKVPPLRKYLTVSAEGVATQAR